MSIKTIAPIFIAAVAVASTAALAATHTRTGAVKSADSAKHELTLSNGDTFQVGSSVKLNTLKTGEKVAVTYEMKGGKMVASKITPTK
ncbi:DUF1344 domain-containing protein [Hyphomicrobium sp.]|uniref:DUF1344 domain-containing protein n=1 Tax=Hyphomicrobium sp. TaxID=82 RepID=UPI002FDDDD2D